MSTEPVAAAYGSWESPISAEFITSQAIKMSSLEMSEDKMSHLFWVEGRPQENGRQCVVKLDCATGEMSDATPLDVNARSRVHEYGGGQAVPIGNQGDTITCDFSTNRLLRTKYECNSSSSHGEVLSDKNFYRYADMFLDPLEPEVRNNNKRLLFAIREDHTIDKPSEVVNCIVAKSIDESSEGHHIEIALVNAGNNPNMMYSSPRCDPTGTFLCWIQWQHPYMPWDVTELCVGKLSSDGKSLTNVTVVAGGTSENVSQPRWTLIANGCFLVYLSDKGQGWWNIHKAELDPFLTLHDSNVPIPVHTSPVLTCLGYEFGPPAWVFGTRSYDILPDSGDIVCTWHTDQNVLCIVICSLDEEHVLHRNKSLEENCSPKLIVFPLPDTRQDKSQDPYTLSSVTSLVSAGNGTDERKLFLIGGSPASPIGVYMLKLKVSSLPSLGESELTLVKSSMTVLPDPLFVSHPKHIEFPTRLFSKEGEALESSMIPTSHGLFYSPRNVNFKGQKDELPPLLALIHGGPTGQTSTVCRLDIQFFTSRGFAVLDVDYGGSTGYGRDYRNRLKGTWGLTDIEDCCRGAEYLVSSGLVDGNKLCISGGSAGGFTALGCIAFRDTFKAATSSYGIGDLEALACDTHKFESRYLDNLVGPYPEFKTIFEERSPIHHIDDISCPILLLHGVDDKVVLPNQAAMMFDAVSAKNIPAAIVNFEGEGHGWRKADTIQKALNMELNFYGAIFGYTPDVVETVPVVNLS